jgi:hypothetical protein
MHNPLDQFWAKAKHLKLSSQEKAEGRALLRAGMHLMVQSEALALMRKECADGFETLASALVDRPILRETFWDKAVALLNSSFVRVPVTACMIFVLGGGVLAAAAENALPGDTLYAVKVSFTEPILGAFKRSNKKQEAEWSMHLLERRLDEAEAIATTPNAQRRADPAAKALREQTSEFLNAVDTMLPGDENEELRRAAVREFDARANHVTSRTRNDPTTHEIIRAMLDAQRRIEKATRSSSSSSVQVVLPQSSGSASSARSSDQSSARNSEKSKESSSSSSSVSSQGSARSAASSVLNSLQVR